MSVTVEEFIEHYGVRGMKWGVRKPADPMRSASRWKERKDKERAEKAKDSRQNGSKKEKTSSDKPPTKPVQKKESDMDKVRRLNDAELRDAVARLQLEKQYRELSAASRNADVKKTKSKGKAFVDEVKTIGMQSAKKAATEVATEAIKKELKKQLKI